MSHTPGPWKISQDGFDIENVEGAGVCTLYADETADDNARLIASAPELLKAIKGVCDALEPYLDTEADIDIQDRERGWLIQAKAVIAKAEGREP